MLHPEKMVNVIILHASTKKTHFGRPSWTENVLTSHKAWFELINWKEKNYDWLKMSWRNNLDPKRMSCLSKETIRLVYNIATIN